MRIGFGCGLDSKIYGNSSPLPYTPFPSQIVLMLFFHLHLYILRGLIFSVFPTNCIFISRPFHSTRGELNILSLLRGIQKKS